MGDQLGDFDRQVRFAVYRHFLETGQAPAASDLAGQLGAAAAEIEAAFARLEAAHALALAPGSRNIWMAHPFSAVPTRYPVRTPERQYWANCAWDALGIAALTGGDASCPTHCPDCAAPIDLRVRGGRVEPGDAVVQFLVPARRFRENVGFT